jgi:hypothetical protein
MNNPELLNAMAQIMEKRAEEWAMAGNNRKLESGSANDMSTMLQELASDFRTLARKELGL